MKVFKNQDRVRGSESNLNDWLCYLKSSDKTINFANNMIIQLELSRTL